MFLLRFILLNLEPIRIIITHWLVSYIVIFIWYYTQTCWLVHVDLDITWAHCVDSQPMPNGLRKPILLWSKLDFLFAEAILDYDFLFAEAIFMTWYQILICKVLIQFFLFIYLLCSFNSMLLLASTNDSFSI